VTQADPLGTVATLVYDCDIPVDGHQKGAETCRINSYSKEQNTITLRMAVYLTLLNNHN
jgi:hypothetical protein